MSKASKLLKRMIPVCESLKPVNESHSHVVKNNDEILFTGSKEECEAYLAEHPDSGTITECDNIN